MKGFDDMFRKALENVFNSILPPEKQAELTEKYETVIAQIRGRFDAIDNRQTEILGQLKRLHDRLDQGLPETILEQDLNRALGVDVSRQLARQDTDMRETAL